MNTRAPLLALAIAASISVTAHIAHAEFWAERAGQLFRTATRVEIVRITASATGSATYTVEQSLRGGRAAGTTDTLASGYFARALPSTGQRALVVCNGAECPRAIGVERGGVWILNAQEPGDGAAVLPPIVDDASMRAMTAGRTAPPLCVRLNTRFAQSSVASPPIEVRVDAAEGTGNATGALVGSPRTAQFGIPFASERESDFSVTMSGSRTQVTFDGHITGRAPDGCVLADAHVERPVARTPTELSARLGGSAGSAVLARGTIHPVPGPARLSEATPVSLASEGSNQLTLRFGAAVGSGVEETVGLTEQQPTALYIGFHHGSTSATYPALLVEVPRSAGRVLTSATTAVLDALPPGRTIRWRIFYTADGRTRVPAGEIELTGERAP